MNHSSNETTTILLTEAARTERPLGVHFLSPMSLMKFQGTCTRDRALHIPISLWHCSVEEEGAAAF